VPESLPAGLSAVVEDAQQREVVKLALDGEGSKALPQQVLGAFTFTPKSGEMYRLRLAAGDKQLDRLPLPQAVASGVTLSTTAGVVPAHQPLRIQLRSTQRRQVLVLVACRGRTVDQKIVEVGEQSTDVTLDPLPGASGVLRVTVYDKVDDGWQPAAERLLYRVPGEYLNLSAKLSKEPGNQMRMRLEARTEANVLIPAWLHAMVWDEKGPRAGGPSLPAFFFVTSELREPQDLEDADILLTSGSAAAKAADLFLGTQGWRRFSQQPRGALAKLVASREGRSAASGSEPTVLAAGTYLKGIQERSARVLHDRTEILARQAEGRFTQLQLDRANAVNAEQLTAAKLAAYEQEPLTILRWCVAGVLVLLILAGALQLLAGLVVAWRARRSPRMLLGGAFACLLVAVVLFASSQPLRIVTEGPSGLSEMSDSTAGAAKLFAKVRTAGDEPGQAVRDKVRDAKVHTKVYASAPTQSSGLQSYGAGGPGGFPESAKAPLLDLQYLQLADSSARTFQLGLETVPSAKERFDYATRASNNMRGQYSNSAPMPAGAGGAQGGGSQEFKKTMDTPAKGGGGGFGGSKAVEDDKSKDGKAGRPTTALLREYAPMQSSVSTQPSGMVLWHPLLVAADGTAESTFFLPSQGTPYHITVFGHTSGGRVGVLHKTVDSGK
jgi:hypothetical protein